MPYYEKAEDWLHQSALLLQARPSTTRITTRYHLKPARRTPKSKNQTKDASTTETQQPEFQQQEDTKPPRGHLVLKTFDPHSGVTLKYKTSKAAEVSRLVQMLGTLGKRMAGVSVSAPTQTQEQGGDVVMADAAAAGEVVEGPSAAGSGVQTPVSRGETPAGAGQGAGAGGAGAAGGGGGGGGKGKKKKGKR